MFFLGGMSELWPVLRTENAKIVRMTSAIFIDVTIYLSSEKYY